MKKVKKIAKIAKIAKNAKIAKIAKIAKNINKWLIGNFIDPVVKYHSSKRNNESDGHNHDVEHREPQRIDDRSILIRHYQWRSFKNSK